MLIQGRNLRRYIGKEVYIFIIRTVGQELKYTAVTPWLELDSPVVFNQRPRSVPACQDISPFTRSLTNDANNILVRGVIVFPSASRLITCSRS